MEVKKICMGFRVDSFEHNKLLEGRRLYNQRRLEKRLEPVSFASFLRVIAKLGMGYLVERLGVEKDFV